jgi:aminoglycoside phosphotransferase (APT) family kinase protein
LRWSSSRRDDRQADRPRSARGLETELADELAKIHAIPPERLPFLRSADVVTRFEHELDSVGDPHPALEYGLWWLREHRPEPLPDVVAHGDFRLGNVVVSGGLVCILDWSSRTSRPARGRRVPLVRAWRFGVTTGGWAEWARSGRTEYES